MALLRRGAVAHHDDFRFPMVLADLLQVSGQVSEAVEAFERAIALNPNEPWLHARLALALRDLKRFDAAESAAVRAAQLGPGDPENHLTRARVHQAAQNHVDAAEAALEALRLNPDSSDAVSLAGATLLAAGQADRACEVALAFTKAHPDDLPVALAISGRMTYAESFTARQRTDYSLAMAQRVQSQLPGRPQPPIRDPRPERPLRIGYLSQDIARRSSIVFFIDQVFACHDRDSYPITCYLTQSSLGQMTERMKGHLSRWVDVERMSDEALVDRIRKDKIDILVDLAGRTPGHRIPALLLGPAPIVMNAIGDPLTTGLSCINYRLVDEITDPPGSESHWIETLVRLPKCFLCYQPPDDAPPPRRPVGSKDGVVFGSLNILAKTGPGVIALWARLLKQVAGSRLLLKAPPLSHPRMRAAIEERFAAHGVPADRLILLGHSPDLPDHLRTYEQIDISLDPWPYNGTTTSCESLWMGVPMVSLAGEAHVSRVGASLLTAVGLESLVAKNEDDFVSIAAGLANDHSRLRDLHAGLRARMAGSILCDGPAHARSIETAFREVWRARCAALS